MEDSKLKTNFVILDKTVKFDYFTVQYNARKFKGLSNNFKEKNKFVVNLKKRFPTNYKYHLVSKREIYNFLNIGAIEGDKFEMEYKAKKIPMAPGEITSILWKPFYQKYPDAPGYYSFSRIGFSSDKRFALLEVLGKGAYWNSNDTYLLEKKNGLWKISGGFGSKAVAQTIH